MQGILRVGAEGAKWPGPVDCGDMDPTPAPCVAVPPTAGGRASPDYALSLANVAHTPRELLRGAARGL